MEELKAAPSNSGHVTVMRSHDYCHFEISLPLPPCDYGPDREHYLGAVDEVRKECARLVDKAVDQYKEAKRVITMSTMPDYEIKRLRVEVERINKEVPENERTPNDKAHIKALADYDYWRDRDFDYDYDDEQR